MRLMRIAGYLGKRESQRKLAAVFPRHACRACVPCTDSGSGCAKRPSGCGRRGELQTGWCWLLRPRQAEKPRSSSVLVLGEELSVVAVAFARSPGGFTKYLLAALCSQPLASSPADV
ncbi:hypothetical protein GRJ2_000205800 [Grus japonensis]|uniref:Uncharacterized protein n=1 Tax=Grus japonensis TaxID=30415 RepID=A0ABC9VVG8_GRUJA